MYLHAVLRDLRGRTGHQLNRYQAMAMVKPCPMRNLPMKFVLFAASQIDILATTKLAAEPVGVRHNTDEAST